MTDDDVKPIKPPKRPRRRPKKPNPEVRARLIGAATELMSEHDPSEMRIDEVAERAGVSVGTFYLYFDGKDDLFTSLVVDQTARLRERLAKAPASGADNVLAAQQRLTAYLDFVDENRQGFLHFLRAGSLETTVGDLNTWAFSQHALDTRPAIDAVLADARVSEVERELVVQASLAVTQHLAGYWLHNEDRISRDDVQQFVTELTTAVIAHLVSR